MGHQLISNLKLWKAQSHKIRQSGQFLGRTLVPLLKTRLLFMYLNHQPKAP